ncbi:MAG: hypothetical protein H0T53_05400 [Herpetosiphonaceae bacterium]|nr:hypothetical protein [Herpetosiphonaceae bacterium]
MAQICVVCRTSIADDSVFCPNCGARQPEPGAVAAQPTLFGVDAARPDEADDRTVAIPPARSAPDRTPTPLPPSSPPQSYPPPVSPYAPPPAQSGPPAPSQPGGYQYGAAPGQTPYPPPPGAYGPPQYGPPQPGGYQYGAAPGQTPYPPPPGYGPPAYPPQPGAKVGGRGNIGRWLIGVGLVLLLAAGGFAIYQATRDSSAPGSAGLINSNTSATSTPRPTRTPRATATPADDDQPTPAPTDLPLENVRPALAGASGQLIYVSPDSYELVAVPASGGDETPLAFEDYSPFMAEDGKISPDGTKAVAYSRKGNGAVFTISAGDGSGSREAANLSDTVPYELIWAPDSSKVAFIVNDADSDDNSEQNIFVLDAGSGAISQVTTSGNLDTGPLSWSTDSTQLIYALTVPDGDTMLHTINADGSNERSLVKSYAYGAWWMPDGRIIYEDFCDPDTFDRGICLLDPNTSQVETLAPVGDNSLSGLSPDGKWAMLENYSDGSLSLLNIETQAIEIVAPAQTGEEITYRFWSLWSPDSAYVTYRSLDNYVTYAYEVGSEQPATPLTSESLIAWVP